MPRSPQDRRAWNVTDRLGERLTAARPAAGVEVVSISGSSRHWRDAHDGFTVALIHRGQEGLLAQWTTRGRSMAAGSGDIMAIEPGDVHVTQRLQVSPQGADFDLVRLSPSLVADVAHHLGTRTAFHFKSPTMTHPAAFDALRGLVHALAEGRDEAELEAACACAAHAVVTRLAESPTLPLRPAVVDYRLRRLKDYLHASVTRRPTLAELEGVAQLSRWRICVVFEQTFGTSIGNYWRALRARQGARSLQRGTPIKLIVGELGYADSPHFCREFKAHYGVTPGRWLALLGAGAAQPTRPPSARRHRTSPTG